MSPFWRKRHAEIIELSKGYTSRREFQADHPDAYRWLKKYGMVNRVIGHLPVIKVWTVESATAAVLACKSRNEAYTKKGGAICALRAHGVLKEVIEQIPHKCPPVKREDCFKAAAKFKTRQEFAKQASNQYNWLSRKGLLDEACAHMPSLLTNWTVDAVKELAAPFESRKDFERAHPTATRWVYWAGVADEVFSHMEYHPIVSDYDVIYLWSVKDDPTLFKPGTTSRRIGRHRVDDVASRGGLEVGQLVMRVADNARKVETDLLALGRPHRFEREFSGCTEFRRYSPQDVERAFELISPYEEIAA